MYKRIHKTLKLSHHTHTSRRLPNHATSHGVLVFLVLITGLVLGISTTNVLADSYSYDLNLNGAVKGPPPSQGAVILSPANGAKTGSSSVSVSGTCPADTFVQIYRNNAFAGSTACEGGKFSIRISLAKGTNTLLAKVLDSFNQYGPDSNSVNVTYQPPAGSAASKVPPLVLSSDNPYLRSINTKEVFGLDLAVSGGKAPYAISVEWGDNGRTDTFPQAVAGLISASHAFDRAGVHVINTQATDTLGNKAYLQYVVIVNGVTPASIAAGNTDSEPTAPYVEPSLPVLWPLYLLLLALVLAFWLGERYELHKLKASHRLIS